MREQLQQSLPLPDVDKIGEWTCVYVRYSRPFMLWRPANDVGNWEEGIISRGRFVWCNGKTSGKKDERNWEKLGTRFKVYNGID